MGRKGGSLCIMETSQGGGGLRGGGGEKKNWNIWSLLLVDTAKELKEKREERDV